MVISIANNKGGVGKTTTAVSIGTALSFKGKRVLIVDLDNQCNATSILFGPRQEHIRRCLYDLLNPDENIDPTEAIYSTQHSDLSILPNIADSAILGPRMIIHGESSLYLLRERLRSYALKNFDITILDCPPNLEAFVIAALVASDFVVVPTMAGSRFSLNGLTNAKIFIDDIRDRHNPDLRFLKLLITMADRRTTICNTVIKSIRQSFDTSEVFSQSIPVCTDFQKAEMLGQSIYGYNSSAAGAKAYMNVANEIINFLELRNQE